MYNIYAIYIFQVFLCLFILFRTCRHPACWKSWLVRHPSSVSVPAFHLEIWCHLSHPTCSRVLNTPTAIFLHVGTKPVNPPTSLLAANSKESGYQKTFKVAYCTCDVKFPGHSVLIKRRTWDDVKRPPLKRLLERWWYSHFLTKRCEGPQEGTQVRCCFIHPMNHSG